MGSERPSSLLDDPRWKRLVAEGDGGLLDNIKQELLDGMEPSGVRDLLDVAEGVDGAEREMALRLLIALGRRKHQALVAERQRWLATSLAIVKEDFPNTPASVLAFQALRGTDRAAAERFIVDDLDVARVTSEAGQKTLVTTLQSFATFGSTRALERLASLRLSEAATAQQRDALRALQPISPREIAELGRQWREERSVAALDRLYARYIGGLPAGTVLLTELVTLLGPPTRTLGRSVWYQPTEGMSLYLEADDAGRLTSSHLA